MPGTPTTIPTILESAYQSMNEGDPEPLIAAYATHDVVLIGTDEADWHERTDAIAAALRAEAGQVRADWDLRPVELGGDALLLVGRISFVLSDGTVIPARATHVLRREGSDWRIAHSHLSVARRE